MEKRTTIYDIAHTAGVSPATVSRMIHRPDLVAEGTRQKILQAFSDHRITPEDLATRKKTVPTTRQGAGTGQNILISVPSLENPFYHEIINAVCDYFHAEHYQTVISTEVPSRESMPSFLNNCSTLQIAGIILMYPMQEDSLRRLHAAYPLVQCSEYNPFYQEVPYVSIDDYGITRAALLYLVRAGCQKIGFFSAPFEFRFVQNRYRAYCSVLSDNHLKIRSDYVVQAADFSYERILAAAKQFYCLPDPPDAVFAVSDEHAHAVIRAGKMLGFRIPEDVRVFGFDDTLYATLSTPAISTVAQPRRELGMESARILLELIRHPDIPQESRLLPAGLKIRESTGYPSVSST